MDLGRLGIIIAVLCWVLPSPAPLVGKLLKRLDPITYEHFKLRAETKKAVHAAKSPIPCNDGRCKEV